jgi:hypothetical protein
MDVPKRPVKLLRTEQQSVLPRTWHHAIGSTTLSCEAPLCATMFFAAVFCATRGTMIATMIAGDRHCETIVVLVFGAWIALKVPIVRLPGGHRHASVQGPSGRVARPLRERFASSIRGVSRSPHREPLFPAGAEDVLKRLVSRFRTIVSKKLCDHSSLCT